MTRICISVDIGSPDIARPDVRLHLRTTPPRVFPAVASPCSLTSRLVARPAPRARISIAAALAVRLAWLVERREAWSASINEKDWCDNAKAYRPCRPHREPVARHLALFWLWRDRSCVRCPKAAWLVLSVQAYR